MSKYSRNVIVEWISDPIWDRRFLELARHISDWSKDPSTKVGAVVVNKDKEFWTGYNGFPPGTDDSPEIYNDRQRKYRRIIHAEINAITLAGKEGCKGSRLYVYPTFAVPNICCECAKLAIKYGLLEVVSYQSDVMREDWKESILEAKNMLDEAGVLYRYVPND